MLFDTKFIATSDISDSNNRAEKSIVDEPINKKRICWNMLSSNAFNKLVEPLDTDKWCRYYRWKRLNRNTRRYLTDAEEKFFICSRLTFPFQSVEVHLNLNGNGNMYLDARVYICLGRDLRTKARNLLDFYISEEYNINLESKDYIAGRFIFVKEKTAAVEEDDDQMIVLYLAAEGLSLIHI